MFTKAIFDQLKVGLTGNGNRSSDRTDDLHMSVINELVKLVPDLHDRYDVTMEEQIPCGYGRKFKIDVLLKDKVTKEIVLCILIKAYISSLQKNAKNNANCVAGETIRIKAVNGRDDVKVWFITFVGNRIPNYKNNGQLRGMDKKEKSYVDFAKNPLLVQKNVYHTTITYDILNVDYSTKVSFCETLQENNIHNVDNESFLTCANEIFGNVNTSQINKDHLFFKF